MLGGGFNLHHLMFEPKGPNGALVNKKDFSKISATWCTPAFDPSFRWRGRKRTKMRLKKGFKLGSGVCPL